MEDGGWRMGGGGWGVEDGVEDRGWRRGWRMGVEERVEDGGRKEPGM